MLIRFNKPYGVLSQFTPEGKWLGLSDFIQLPGVYVAGRLDADSEGLLLLTDDGQLQARIADPRFKMEKTYLAQVEGVVNDEALRALERGVQLNDGPTLPARARSVDTPNTLWPRTPPIRERQNKPTSWLELTLREGRNRQVRRMSAAVGLPMSTSTHSMSNSRKRSRSSTRASFWITSRSWSSCSIVFLWAMSRK